MAKNVGKTVVLNNLICTAADKGVNLGLTSIGRDGEEWDAVFRTPKPRISAPEGSIVATASASLQRAGAKVAILDKTGYRTPLGEVVIVRVITAGLIELAGAMFASQQREVWEKLYGYGADIVLTDGALDRTTPASLSACDGVILATGATVGAAVADVIAKTRDRVERLSLPRISGEEAEACRRTLVNKRGAVISNGEIIPLATYSITAGQEIKEIVWSRLPDAAIVVLGGAVGDDVLIALNECLTRTGRLQLVIRSGAYLFAARHLWRSFVNAGG